MRKYAKLLLIAALVSCVGCSEKPLYRDTRIMMGSTLEVISPDKDSAAIVFAEIGRIEGLISKYRPDSEISVLNAKGEIKASPETIYVLKRAGDFWRQSGGAFDATVGPLMDLWGFTSQNYRVPSQQEIDAALKRVGFDKIIIDERNRVVKFKVPGVEVDLGGIGAGFAVDCAVKKLKEKGITSCLINAGGDIYCLGDKGGKAWKIAVQNPYRPGFTGYLELKDTAVTTSGDYEKFFMRGKKRYSHIFDPRRGYPVDNGLTSVTIVAPDTLTADALATTVFVMGEKEGGNLVRKFPGARVEAIDKSETAGKQH